MGTTNIKAVELIRQIRDRHYAQLEGKTPNERIAYYQAKARALHEKAQVLVQDQPVADQQETINR